MKSVLCCEAGVEASSTPLFLTLAVRADQQRAAAGTGIGCQTAADGLLEAEAKMPAICVSDIFWHNIQYRRRPLGSPELLSAMQGGLPLPQPLKESAGSLSVQETPSPLALPLSPAERKSSEGLDFAVSPRSLSHFPSLGYHHVVRFSSCSPTGIDISVVSS